MVYAYVYVVVCWCDFFKKSSPIVQHSTFACSVRVRRPARVRVHVPDCACMRVRTRA